MRDAQTNAVANIEGEVTQAVFFDDVPVEVKDGVDEERGEVTMLYRAQTVEVARNVRDVERAPKLWSFELVHL